MSFESQRTSSTSPFAGRNSTSSQDSLLSTSSRFSWRSLTSSSSEKNSSWRTSKLGQLVSSRKSAQLPSAASVDLAIRSVRQDPTAPHFHSDLHPKEMTLKKGDDSANEVYFY